MTSGVLVGGAVAAALLVLGAVALHRTDGGDAWSYVLFACAGLLPLPGVVMGQDLLRLEGPRGIQFLLLLYAASLATGLGLSLLTGRTGKNRGAFVAKGVAVSLAALVLASGGGLLVYGLTTDSTAWVHAEKVTPPSRMNQTSLTPGDLERYPALEEAMQSGEAEAGPDEFFALKTELRRSDAVRIDGKLFKVSLRSGLRMRSVEGAPGDGAERASTEEFPDVPGVRRAVDRFEELSGESPSTVAVEVDSEDDYDRIAEFLGGRRAVLKVDGAYVDASLRATVHLDEVAYPPRNATTVTDDDLDSYPEVRSAIEEADREGSGTVAVPEGEWNRLREDIEGPVEYGGSYYRIGYLVS